VVLKAVPKEAVNGFIDALDLFGIGAAGAASKASSSPPSPIAPHRDPVAAEGPLAPPHRPRKIPSPGLDLQIRHPRLSSAPPR